MNYHKYLKYKTKYLELKELIGGYRFVKDPSLLEIVLRSNAKVYPETVSIFINQQDAIAIYNYLVTVKDYDKFEFQQHLSHYIDNGHIRKKFSLVYMQRYQSKILEILNITEELKKKYYIA